MAMHTFATGEVATAANLNEYCVNTKYVAKASNTNRTGTTPAADPDLALTYDASKTYILELIVLMQGGSGGFKFNFTSTGSNNAYGLWQSQASAAGAGTVTGGTYDGGVNNNLATTFSLSSITGAGLVDTLEVRAFWQTGASAGTLTFQWSQNTGVGSTNVLAGSAMLLRRVA